MRTTIAAHRLPGLSLLCLTLAAGPGIRAQEPAEGTERSAPEVPQELLLGHRAEVTWNARTSRGELLAADSDTLWLLEGPGPVVRIPLADVDRVRIRRHRWDTQRALLWAGVGGVVTGGALSMACGRVEDTDCGGVFVGALATWITVGVIAAVSFEKSRNLELGPTDSELRRFTRFPQGLPPGYGTDQVESPSGERGPDEPLRGPGRGG